MDWIQRMTQRTNSPNRRLRNVSIKSKIFWIFLGSNFLAVLIVAALVIGDQYAEVRTILEDDLLTQANIVADNAAAPPSGR